MVLVASVDNLLRALGLPVNGSVLAKKEDPSVRWAHSNMSRWYGVEEFFHFGPGIYIQWVTRGVYFVFYCRGGILSTCGKKRFVYSLLSLDSMNGLLVFVVYT